MRLLLIVMGVIPLFLASIILDFRSVRSKLFNAPHVVSKHAFEYGNYTANNQLDAMIHVGMFKTGTTTLQMALGWSIYEELVSEGYYFLGKTGGTATMNKKDSFHALVKDVVRFLPVHVLQSA